MLRHRLISSTILVTVVLALFYCDFAFSTPERAGLLMAPVLLFFAMGTAFDVASVMKQAGYEVRRRWLCPATGAIAMSPLVPALSSLLGIQYPKSCPLGSYGLIVATAMAALTTLLLYEILTFRDATKASLSRTLVGVFAILYVGLPMALMVIIRQQVDGSAYSTDTGSEIISGVRSQWGFAALVTFIAVTKSSDAGAYFCGKLLGRRKLIPRLSPGKTWEGLAGGILAAVAVSFLCFNEIFPRPEGQSWQFGWQAAAFGLACAVFGVIGDLAESLMKREAGKKDSGNWLPGLGGVWDVTDSLIGAVAPAWLLLTAGIGPS